MYFPQFIGCKASFALAGLFALIASASALPVNLGAAGPGNWAVLQVGNGTVTEQTDLSNPQGGVFGNVGIQQNGKLQGSGPQITGDLYLGDNATAQFSGNYTGNMPVTGTTHLGTGASVGPGSYNFNRVYDNPQALLTQARNDAINASAAAAALTPTSALQNLNLSSTNITLTAGVYNLSSFNLNHATLTLSGPGSFVFNISSTFVLNTGQVLLANGATESEVLFNYTGTSAVAFSGGGNSSEFHGIILALNAKVNLAPGLVVGEIISGQDISIVSGAMVVQPTMPSSVPDSGSTLALFSLAVCALVTVQRYLPALRRAS